MAARVGVRLPFKTPPAAVVPPVEVRPVIAVPIAVALFVAMLTATVVALTPQVLPMSAKNLSPQFTSVWVSLTTWLIAGVITAHFDVVPQPAFPHDVFVASSFIDPEASRMIRMSGGSFDEDFGKVAHAMLPPWPVKPPWPVVKPPPKLPRPVLLPAPVLAPF